MTFQWTDTEVTRLVKLAWQTALASSSSAELGQRGGLADAVAEQIDADAWRWSKGLLTAEDSSTHSAFDWYSHTRRSSERGAHLGSVQVEWTQHVESPRARDFGALSDPDQIDCHQIDDLCHRARRDPEITQAVFLCSGDASADSRRKSVRQAAPHDGHSLLLPQANLASRLVWISIRAHEQIEWVEFIRASAEPPFAERDQIIVRTMFASLSSMSQRADDPVSSDPVLGEAMNADAMGADGGLDDEERQAALQELEALPKRQREVLALLSQGESIKEIARELGISYHTVNDYTKALYRRFGVSGRGELLAHFISEPLLQRVR